VHEVRTESDPDGTVKKVRALNLLAKNLVTKAIAGDVQAAKEIGDRLDGKPAQSMDVTHRRGIAEMTDDELIEIVRGNRTADPQDGAEELPSVH
jgi:hypothetical protein